jgi:hypothetical protein
MVPDELKEQVDGAWMVGSGCTGEARNQSHVAYTSMALLGSAVLQAGSIEFSFLKTEVSKSSAFLECIFIPDQYMKLYSITGSSLLLPFYSKPK